MNKILVVGDAHVSTEENLNRFEYANALIMEKRPEVIVLMGDFITLNCLSFWDKDKRKSMEGRRYQEEIENANKALDLMFKGLYDELMEARKKKEETVYS